VHGAVHGAVHGRVHGRVCGTVTQWRPRIAAQRARSGGGRGHMRLHRR